ncbi:MAG: hypothetical protein HQL71_01060 [Magnetococcales bacterium]|nr:hypothetical protein [Magnetococcales bacterium]
MTEPQNDSLSPTDGTKGGVSHDNFGEVWSYILAKIESGKWDFADWPLENLQEIPLEADADGVAVKDLNQWVNRHLKKETQQKMFKTIDPDWSADLSKPTPSPTTEATQVSSSTDGSKASSPSTEEPKASQSNDEPQATPSSDEHQANSLVESEHLEPNSNFAKNDKIADQILSSPTEIVPQEKTANLSTDDPSSEQISRPPAQLASSEPAANQLVDEPPSQIVARSPSEVVSNDPAANQLVDESASQIVARSPSEVVSNEPAASLSNDEAEQEPAAILLTDKTEPDLAATLSKKPPASSTPDNSTQGLVLRSPTEVVSNEPAASLSNDEAEQEPAAILLTDKTEPDLAAILSTKNIKPDPAVSLATESAKPDLEVSPSPDKTEPELSSNNTAVETVRESTANTTTDKIQQNSASNPATEEVKAKPDNPSTYKEFVASKPKQKMAYEHKKAKTILKDDFEAKKAEFEAKKAATEIILSEKTRNRLLQYRDNMFGVGNGSMELAIRKLLDGVERTLSLETFQKLTVFQSKNSLSNSDEALNKLLELTSPTKTKDTLSAADSIMLKEELEKLLIELKSGN